MEMEIRFRKSGKEIKQALSTRVVKIEQRLTRRNAALEELMRDQKRLRSYLVRSAQLPWAAHGRGEQALYPQDDISSEEKEEIAQLCRRVFELEQELHRLHLIASHLSDEQVFDLTFEELVAYGFEASLEGE
jgi:hypothetical protein